MNLPSPSVDPVAQPAQPPAVVFRGSTLLCREYSLVLEARGIEHEARESGDAWLLTVAPSLVHLAYDELNRYGVERSVSRSVPILTTPFAGAALGAVGYVVILLLTAYCAGIGLFGADWLSAGDLDAGAPREWWRALTALTLHLDQQHLLGNLLFGVFAGIAAGRLLGPGVAWASIVCAGGLANYAEILIAPSNHRAVGASTAVFAALGLIAGLAWRQRLTLRERRWNTVAPLIASICLLTLLGAGAEHVDVLGHGLGFLFGLAFGWTYARAGIPRDHGGGLQIVTGVGAALLLAVAWSLALA
ncbi:MAG: rhomboid family intramembrane serine protease [Gammaproteobacteria bacterium]